MFPDEATLPAEMTTPTTLRIDRTTGQDTTTPGQCMSSLPVITKSFFSCAATDDSTVSPVSDLTAKAVGIGVAIPVVLVLIFLLVLALLYIFWRRRRKVIINQNCRVIFVYSLVLLFVCLFVCLFF